MNVDKMLAFAGDFGLQQYILMGLFSVINILSAFHYFAQTFISVLPNGYECIASITNTSSNIERRSLSNMELESTLVRSHHYGRCYSQEDQNLLCQNGWAYTLDYNYSSIVDEVCFSDIIYYLEGTIIVNMMRKRSENKIIILKFTFLTIARLIL